MNTFLVPIKVLHDMGIRTKDTYAAAMEGIDLSMVQILKNLGYDHTNQAVLKLGGQSGPERLMFEEAKLSVFHQDNRVGLPEFVAYANRILYDFLQHWKIGHVHSMYLDDDAKFQVEIACLIHSRLVSDHPDADKKLFEIQLQRLIDNGFVIEKIKNMGHYQMLDNDNNRQRLLELLDCKCCNVFITSNRGYIRRINFTIQPKQLYAWKTESIVTAPSNNSNDMTDDEYKLVSKLINNISHSLKMASCDDKMKTTCCGVAESYFAQLCEIVGFEGNVARVLKERYAEERAANSRSRDIGSVIGAEFPVGICSDTMSKIKHNLTKYCVENLHSVVRNLRISEIGVGYFDVDWVFDPEDFWCYMDVDFIDNQFDVPDLLNHYDDVFDIYRGGDGQVYLYDTEKNRDCIIKFLRTIPGVKVESINIEHRDDFGGICVIKEIRAKMDNVIGILNYYSD